MNLNNIVSEAIAVIHPKEPIELYLCTGRSISEDGAATPSYAEPISLMSQIQDADVSELRHEELTGVSSSQLDIWIDGTAKGIDRITGTGGDMLRARGRWWLVTAMTNDFSNVGWVCLRVTMQLTEPEGIASV
jgi:hypothetical protein